MNYYKKSKIIYWATPGCSSRRFLGAFNLLEDRYTYNEPTNETGINTIFTHAQGIPPGCEDYKIVCAIRNPYTRVVSHYIDLHEANQVNNFEDYIFNSRYSHYPINHDLFYFDQWKNLRYPDYFVRLENAENDLKNIPEYVNNLPVPWEDVLSTITEHYGGEKPLDEYDENGHQKVARFYTQETADEVYNKEKIIFDIGEYNRDSWK
tara:strand:- start:344 stop:964 length:621 start_codon:yes stop_codon:yes gene_type:complete